MEQDFFLNKVRCAFVIITHDKDPKIVTTQLDIQPTRFFNNGDKVISKHTTRIGDKPYGLWEFQPDPVVSEELDIHTPIKYIKELLEGKTAIIDKLRDDYNFEIVMDISIETEDAGAGVDLGRDELDFINKIFSRFSCRFISKEKL